MVKALYFHGINKLQHLKSDGPLVIQQVSTCPQLFALCPVEVSLSCNLFCDHPIDESVMEVTTLAIAVPPKPSWCTLFPALSLTVPGTTRDITGISANNAVLPNPWK
jgi:hypothetical protein